MSRIINTELIRSVSFTDEANILACNYSNALSSFTGNSILVSNKIENQEFKKFVALKNKWKDETKYFSSSFEIFNNSAYREIVDLGPKSIPWIIRELKKTDDHWFFALKEIAGVNPVNPDNYGIIPKMKEDWVKWAEQNNM